MQRRSFLRLIGSAIAAPMIPAVGSASGYSRTSYELAIAHAKRFPLVSVTGMSKHIGISTAQADAIVRQMSSEGLLGVLNPTRPGTVRASSRIFTNDIWGLKRTSQKRPDQARKTQERNAQKQAQPKVSALFAHLHDICTQNGLILSPRCHSGVHA